MAPPERDRPSVDRIREALREREEREHDVPPETPPADDGGDEQPETGPEEQP